MTPITSSCQHCCVMPREKQDFKFLTEFDMLLILKLLQRKALIFVEFLHRGGDLTKVDNNLLQVRQAVETVQGYEPDHEEWFTTVQQVRRTESQQRQ